MLQTYLLIVHPYLDCSFITSLPLHICADSAHAKQQAWLAIDVDVCCWIAPMDYSVNNLISLRRCWTVLFRE